MRFYAAGGLSAPQFQCIRGRVCKKVRELPVEQSAAVPPPLRGSHFG
jgi:hypothetical protein